MHASTHSCNHIHKLGNEKCIFSLCLAFLNYIPYRQSGFTALMIASQKGHVEVVNTLLQHGARVDLQKKVNSFPLIFACV